MKIRLITSAVGIILLAIVMLFFDTLAFNLVIAAFCLIAIHEIYSAFHFDHALYLYVAFVPYTLLVMFTDFPVARKLLLPVSYIFALYIAICVILNSKSINFAKVSGMVMFSGIVMFCFYSLIYLKALLPQSTYGYDAIYFIMLILGFAWGGDSAAYFAGRFFGKHKMAPVVSPHKTWEGALGGICGSMALGVLITLLYAGIRGRIFDIPLDTLGVKYYVMILCLGAVASVLGILGDLFASVIKRQCEIKDYGKIFPGHGGVLDRFDSLLFIAPFVCMIVTATFYYFTR